MPTPMFAPTFVPLVAVFAECFTAPTFQSFQWLPSGWLLCITNHTVTGVLRAASAVEIKHHTTFHRFFRLARWVPDQVGLQLLKLAMSVLPKEADVVVALDDTLGRHVGPKIRGASMHHDPLLSTRTKVVHHWGHVWVILTSSFKSSAGARASRCRSESARGTRLAWEEVGRSGSPA